MINPKTQRLISLNKKEKINRWEGEKLPVIVCMGMRGPRGGKVQTEGEERGVG